MRKDFWQGKRILLTGHTGFKGAWFSLWLGLLGADVTGISLPPAMQPNLYDASGVASKLTSNLVDIRDLESVTNCIRQAKPDIVFHMAAQPLVLQSYTNPLETYATNIMGTAHVLEALRQTPSVRVAVMITTDKVYANNEWLYPYREIDPLGGHDPYSASKAACEIVIASYRDSFLSERGVAVASARAGNVIGGGDWADNRLIPDIMRARQAKGPLRVRHPEAVRPWQHVLEALHSYLVLAEKLWHKPEMAGAYNFGPASLDTVPVSHVLQQAVSFFPELAIENVKSGVAFHESHLLLLDNTKAQSILGIKPVWTVHEALLHTFEWYKAFYAGEEAERLCLADLRSYVAHVSAGQDCLL